MLDFVEHDATSLADLVRKRELSPRELIDAAIDKIERLDGPINAVVWRRFAEAREEAEGALPRGPFTGVPFALKDVIAPLAGAPLTEGSRLGAGNVSDHDAELVERYKRAGLVILGRTNTSEFGIVPTAEPALHGACRNPWDTTRSTGGSSGGAAAAVAAGMLPAAHAADGGGSIRIPAACCGLFGLKPTRARNPLGPDHQEIYQGLVVEHAITRSVRDSAALLDATCGPDLGDPYWAPPRERPYLEEVGRAPGRLRIAFSAKAPTGVPVHADCAAAVADVAALCAGLGHDVVEGAPVVDSARTTQSFIALYAACNAQAMEGLGRATGRKPSPELLEPLAWALYQMGQSATAVQLLDARHGMGLVARQIARFFTEGSCDVWLTPTVAEPPLPLGSFLPGPNGPLDGLFRSAAFCPFTPLANLTGQPAMSVPLWWNGSGLPIGVQFMGRFGDEATLFRLAGQLEAARPWKQQRPPARG